MKKNKQHVEETKKEDELKLVFNLSGIGIVNFSYNPPIGLALPLPSYRYQIIVKHGIILKTKSILVLVSAIIKNADESETLGKIDVAYNFIIENFEEIVNTSKDDLIIDERVLHQLNSISISTTRGIAFSKFQDTPISNAIMPVYDLSQLKGMTMEEIEQIK